MESHRRGDLTEQIVITELKRREISVSTPVGDNERYDLVLEQPDGELLRAQVKTGWLTDGTIRFKGVSQHTNSSGHVYERYGSEVDCFLVYCYDTEEVYLISGEEVGTSVQLRIDPPEQESKQINWAEEYRLAEQWPLGSDPDIDESVSVAIEALQVEGVSVFTDHKEERSRTLVAGDGADTVWTVRVETGWLVDGRIRFTASNPADVYLVYCSEIDRLYSIHPNEFDESISLRVDDVSKRSNPAEAYRFENNWPPVVEPAGGTHTVASRTIEALEVDGYTASISSQCDDGQTIIAEDGDSEYRIRIEPAWSEGDLLRFTTNVSADFYVIEHPDEWRSYLIPDDAFGTSISLRVTPPKKEDPRINYADEFELTERWPP